ncbi:MAG: hypothetical protein HYW47_04470 [Deltaproteobacteria bacterium]|nr:hypothetical protein [Deltaproteobacteria bacterium]
MKLISSRPIKKFFGVYVPDCKEANEEAFLNEVSQTFSIDRNKIHLFWKEYLNIHKKNHYTERFGEHKTLNREETFILYLVQKLLRPETTVEIGCQYGNSTRRIIDIRKELNLTTKPIVFEVDDRVREFEKNEVEFYLEDVTQDIHKKLLNKYEGGMIYLDAHPYFLLENIISGVLNTNNWVLCIHDCTVGLFNPKMKISKTAVKGITSKTGAWERYVLADLFGIANPSSPSLNNTETKTHRLRIFSTYHGLALIYPKTLHWDSDKK